MSYLMDGLTHVAEHPVTGMNTWTISDEVAATVDTYLQEAHGTRLEETARNFYYDGEGRPTFETGGNYDFISSDLLGGKADGLRERHFMRWLERTDK